MINPKVLKPAKFYKNEKRKEFFPCGPCGPYLRLCKILCPKNLKLISETM